MAAARRLVLRRESSWSECATPPSCGCANLSQQPPQLHSLKRWPAPPRGHQCSSEVGPSLGENRLGGRRLLLATHMVEKHTRCRQLCRLAHRAHQRGRRHGSHSLSQEGPQLGRHRLRCQLTSRRGRPHSWWRRPSRCHLGIRPMTSVCERLRGTRIVGPKAGNLHDAASRRLDAAVRLRGTGVRGATQGHDLLFPGKLGTLVQEPQDSCDAF